MIKERPIIFSTDMVKAILEGRKTQTRRLLNPQPDIEGAISYTILPPGYSQDEPKDLTHWQFELLVEDEIDIQDTLQYQYFKCPYGKPGDHLNGDLLYVRETFCYIPEEGYIFKADVPQEDWKRFVWKPSIHLPKKAARLWLQFRSLKVERLQDISEEDAIAEGVKKLYETPSGGAFKPYMDNTDLRVIGVGPINSFSQLWKSIHGPNSWDLNPWVWVVEFEVVSKDTH